MKIASKTNVFQKMGEINIETSLNKKVMMRAWLLKKNGGVTKSFTYQTAWRETKEQSYSVFEFSECLKRAWQIEKENLKVSAKKIDINISMLADADTISSWYRSGKNMGD